MGVGRVNRHEIKTLSDQRPLLTAEIYALPLERGRYLVYAPLRRTAFIGSTQMLRLILSLQGKGYREDLDPDGSLTAFLRRLNIVDGGNEYPPIIQHYCEPQTTEVTLLLTTGCNLRCTYCYASAGDTPPKFMSLETARSGIDFVVQTALRRGTGRFAVSYHGGGEPTTNWTVLTSSRAYARELARQHNMQCDSSICTNGILSDKRIDWIVSNLSGATVSFDGIPEVHDRQRPMVTGQGSSKHVIKTLRHFDKAGFSYTIRITVMAESVCHLPDTVDYVFSNFQPGAVQVEPLYLLGRGRDNKSAETEAFIQAYREAQTRAAHGGKRIGFSAARAGLLTSHFCQATIGNFCLSASGNVTACYEVFEENHPYRNLFFYGRPSGQGGFDFDDSVLAGLRAQSVENREFCRDCFCRWSCAGDCYHKGLSVHGEAPIKGTGRCRVTRELTKDQLLEKIAASGGIAWLGDEGQAHGQLC